jgi:lipoprotein-anchoring transpeptidase ErfK/SrfK
VCRDTAGALNITINSLVFNSLELAWLLHFFLAQAIWKSEPLEDAMTALKQNRLAMAAMIAAILALQLTTRSAAQQVAANQPAAKEQASPSAAKREIVVSLEDRKLALVEDGKVIKVYPVAVGKPSTPSPAGTFTIERRVVNPTYSHDGRTVPPGPNNPVGTRWMGLSIRGYGIHGTNVPSSIGKAASHGCIRMARHDLEELFPMVAVGDSVELIGQRNAETAQLFGDHRSPAPAAQPAPQTVMASTATVAPQPDIAISSLSTFTGAGLAAVAGLTVAGSM